MKTVVIISMFLILSGYVSCDDCSPPECDDVCPNVIQEIGATDDYMDRQTFNNCCLMEVENNCNGGTWKSSSCPETL